jgi:tetratricopeptide (TPR) repeat protein
MIVYDTMPTADCAVDALRRANGVLRDQEKASMQDGVPTVDRGVLIEANVQRLVAEHPTDPLCVEALSDLIGYLRDRSAWDAATRASLNDKVVAIVAQMRSLAPDSPLLARPSLAAADALQATDPQQALVLVEDALRLAAADADLRLDAQSLKAHLLETVGRTQEAYDAYLTVYAQAEGPRAVAALRAANLVLIGQERASESTGAVVDNAAAIEANAQRLLAEHPGAVENLEVLLDLVNFHADRPRWNPGARASSKAKVVDTAGLMQSLAPDSALTVRATLQMAEAVRPDDPERALALVDQIVQRAASLDDEGLRLDAQFTKGRMLEDARRPDQAYSAYLSIYTNNPTSERAVAALRAANLVLIGQERASESTGAVVDNAAAVEANAQRLLAEHPGAVENLEVLLDLVNYHADRPRWNPGAKAASKAKVAETVELMQSLAPDSSLTLRGQLQMAEMIQPDQPEQALNLVGQLVSRADATGDERLRLDVRLTQASFLNSAGRASEAAAAYVSVYETMPTNARTIDALRLANVALIDEEIRNWFPRPAADRAGWRQIQHVEAVEANVGRLVSEHPERSARALLDVSDYHRNRAYFHEGAEQASHDRMLECAEQVRRLAPGTSEAVRAGYDMVTVLAKRDLPAASALADQLLAEAAPLNDAQLYMDAKLIRARVLRAAQDYDGAVAIYEQVLATDVPQMWEALRLCLVGELTMDIAMLRTSQGRLAEALALYDGVQRNEQIQPGLRAIAAVHRGLLYEQRGQFGEATDAFGAALELVPGSVTAETAQMMLDRVASQAGSQAE